MNSERERVDDDINAEILKIHRIIDELSRFEQSTRNFIKAEDLRGVIEDQKTLIKAIEASPSNRVPTRSVRYSNG